MASQYAGWTIRCGGRSYIGSGPACAVVCKGSLFRLLGYKDDAERVVLCLESGRLPTEDVVALVTEECACKAADLTILVAPTDSVAGTVQVAARALETALFKLRRVGYELGRVVSGTAVCPVSPVAGSTTDGLGRTNDAISYGATAWLTVRDTDDNLAAVINRVPASAAPGYGLAYSELSQAGDSVFNRGAEGFNPAVIYMTNLGSGNTFTAGELRPDVMRRAFGVKYYNQCIFKAVGRGLAPAVNGIKAGAESRSRDSAPTCVPGMGDNLAVKVRCTLGSRKC
jgi:methenyltetrahydromethanopterin cyclohydrolase